MQFHYHVTVTLSQEEEVILWNKEQQVDNSPSSQEEIFSDGMKTKRSFGEKSKLKLTLREKFRPPHAGKRSTKAQGNAGVYSAETDFQSWDREEKVYEDPRMWKPIYFSLEDIIDDSKPNIVWDTNSEWRMCKLKEFLICLQMNVFWGV